MARGGRLLGPDRRPTAPWPSTRLKAEPFAILLVDLKMPGPDGLEVLRAARSLQPEAAVIIMTAYATVDTAVQAMKAGAYDYLVKPFEPEELSLMVQKIVAQRDLKAENVMLRETLKQQYRFRDLLLQEPQDAVAVRARAGRGAERLHHPDPRRERHRQGAARPRHPRREPARGRALHRRLVRRPDRDAPRERALRPREGRLHRRRPPHQGEVRAGRGRHPVPRRDRRHQPQAAARPPARARGPPLLPHRRQRAGLGGRAHHRLHQPRPQEGGRGPRVPRGPLLPPARHRHHAAAAAGAQGGHARSCATTSSAACARSSASPSTASPATRWTCSWPTTGPATCASSATCSSAARW